MEKFEKREVHPMAKYIGRFVNFYGKRLEVVGYSCIEPLLIVDASQASGWSASALEPFDAVFKECESYWYAEISDLID